MDTECPCSLTSMNWLYVWAGTGTRRVRAQGTFRKCEPNHRRWASQEAFRGRHGLEKEADVDSFSEVVFQVNQRAHNDGQMTATQEGNGAFSRHPMPSN